MRGLGKRIEFDGGNVILEREGLEGTWKETWGKVEKIVKKETESNMKDSYRKKELQSELYRKQYDECNMWLEQKLEPRKTDSYRKKELQSELYRKQYDECNMWLEQKLEPRKTGAIMNLQEKVVETRVWKVSTGLICADDKCRLCGEHRETVDHLLAGCKMLAGNDY